MEKQDGEPRLPVRHSLTLLYALSLLVAILMAAGSLAGLLYGAVLYPAEDLFQAFVPTDVVNLLIGLPILLGSMGLARRHQLIGLLLWPGSLFFVLYTEIVYVLALPLSAVFLLHLVQLTLSVYTLIALVVTIDGQAVQQRLSGAVPERGAGGILAGLGLLFLVRAVAVLAGMLASQAPVAATELGPHVSDLLLAPAVVSGGVLLWRRRPLGYVAGLGLLFQGSMLFIGLIILLLLQPVLTAAPFAPADIAVVFALGLICFVPFVLFARGVASVHASPPG